MPKKAIIAIQTTSDLPRIRSRDPKTTWAQYQAILEWLEIPANFNLVEGRATSTMKTGTVAGAMVTKRAGFAELAAPKSGDITKIVWNVVDNTIFSNWQCVIVLVKSLCHRCAQFRNESIDSGMIYMFNAIKVIDNSMINITYA